MSEGLAGKSQTCPLGGEQRLRAHLLKGGGQGGVGRRWGAVPGKPLTSHGPGKHYNFKELAEIDFFPSVFTLSTGVWEAVIYVCLLVLCPPTYIRH